MSPTFAGTSYICAEGRPLGHELEKEIGPVDIVVEATGFSPLAFDAIDMVGPNGIVCLTGVSGGSRTLQRSPQDIKRVVEVASPRTQAPTRE